MKKRIISSLLVSAFAALLLGACSNAPAGGVDTEAVTETEETTEAAVETESTEVTETETEEVDDGPSLSSAFPKGVFEQDLYTALRCPTDEGIADFTSEREAASVAFSPYSVADCLTLCYDGLSADAKKALDEEGITADRVKAMIAFDKAAGNDATVNVANKVYINENNSGEVDTDLIRADSFEEIAMNKKTAGKINGWISEETNGKIEDLIPSDSITEDTVSVLANALWMKRSWMEPYEENTLAWAGDGLNYQSFSGDSSIYSVRDFEGVTILRLPYSFDYDAENVKDQAQLSMYIVTEDPSMQITPDQWVRLTNHFEKAFDFSEYEGLEGYTDVVFEVPKFHVELKKDIMAELGRIGLDKAFDADAYKKIGPMEASSIFHGASVDTDENGTEAAAATAMVMDATAALPDDSEKLIRTVVVDRPFVFVIKDERSNQILFVGFINNDALEAAEAAETEG